MEVNFLPVFLFSQLPGLNLQFLIHGFNIPSPLKVIKLYENYTIITFKYIQNEI